MRRCAEMAALIPWYANGTLDVQEAEPLRRHILECDRCGRLLEQARGQAQHIETLRSSTEVIHVPSGLLVHFVEQRNRLDSETENWIATHLTQCDACASDLELITTAGEASDSHAQLAQERQRPWFGWLAVLLRPAPALVYLLLLVVAAPVVWRSVDRGGSPELIDSPRVFDAPAASLTTEPTMRGEEGTAPIQQKATSGPQRVDLDLDWTRSDLASVSTVRIDLRRGDVVVQTINRQVDEMTGISGGMRATLWVDYGGGGGDDVYEWTVSVEQPGHTLEGQTLFRRRIQVVR